MMDNPFRDASIWAKKNNIRESDWVLLILKACEAVSQRDNFNIDKQERIMRDLIGVMKIPNRKDIDELYLLMEFDTRTYLVEAIKLIMDRKIKL